MSGVIGADRNSTFQEKEQPYYLKHVSRIKHDILKAYLGAWSGILGTRFPHLAYFDCFAGEGYYVDEDGQELPGSPQHALRVAADFVSKAPARSVTLGFIERDAARARRLERRLNIIDRPKSVQLRVFPADARDLSDQMINLVRHLGWLVPTFFFVDPCGYPLPVPTLRKFLELPKAEVLANLMWYRINMDRSGSPSSERLNKLFGHEEWRGAGLEGVNPQAREQAFIRYFEQQVGTPFHIPFPMTYSPEDNVTAPEKRTKYYLIHFSNHVKAPLVMKEVLYKARGKIQKLHSPASQMSLGFNYRDPRLDELKSILLNTFQAQVISVLKIREKTANEPYVETEYRQVLKEFEKENRVSVERRQSKRDGLADGDIIRFL
jgi:three-Cys-motif partner protein